MAARMARYHSGLFSLSHLLLLLVGSRQSYTTKLHEVIQHIKHKSNNTLAFTMHVDKKAKTKNNSSSINTNSGILSAHYPNEENIMTNTTMQLLSKKALAVINAGLHYNRDAFVPGILHFSTGNFHRAHQASYYHDLFEKTDNVDADRKWGIVEASVRQGGSYTEDLRPSD